MAILFATNLTFWEALVSSDTVLFLLLFCLFIYLFYLFIYFFLGGGGGFNTGSYKVK